METAVTGMRATGTRAAVCREGRGWRRGDDKYAILRSVSQKRITCEKGRNTDGRSSNSSVRFENSVCVSSVDCLPSVHALVSFV